jgi:hypothetical protein
MSAHSSPVSAVSTSALKEQACTPPGSARQTPSVSVSSQNTGRRCRATATSKHYADATSSQSTSSAAGSPAKTSASPDEAAGSQERGRVFGVRTPDLWANFDPATSSWKTSRLYVLGDSIKCSKTSMRAGMTRSGMVFPLVPLAPLTAATASGLLLTPIASNYGSNQGGGAAGRVGPVRHSLREMAKHGLWPTPTARDWKSGTGAKPRKGHALPLSSQIGGQLNPTWVEWLQGFPLGWTEVE